MNSPFFRPWLVVGFGLLPLGLHAAPPESLRWLSYESPSFPMQLFDTLAQDGAATLVFTFDEHGRITDRVVLSATHPAFAAAVYDAVLRWQVDTRDLVRSIHRETIRFEFQRRHQVLAMSQRDAAKSAFSIYGDQGGGRLMTFQEPDLRPGLTMLTTNMPEYPAALKREHIPGSATVNFVVDFEGRVRVPAVTDATSPEFGEAALAAVRQWRFQPPHLNGTAVQVMVDRRFRFGKNAEEK